MGFADLHIHSIYSSDGTGTIPAILKQVADKTPLNVIAITDHDSMQGVHQAIQLAPRYGIEVIPGCEVSTADGHLLALFIKEIIKPGLSLLDTVLMIADQGGIAVAPHPMAKGTSSLKITTICEALQNPCVAKVLVGVELFNGGLVYTRANPSVSRRLHQLDLASVGNSDAHILPMIGRGSTWFEGSTTNDLYTALMNHQTIPQSARGLDGWAVMKSYIPRYVLRKLGWAAWNAAPEERIRYIRYTKHPLDQQGVYL
jgi:predicted metal-dependent phosphoesterase TrpH